MPAMFRTILFLTCSAFAIPALAADNPFASPSTTWLAAGEGKCAPGKCEVGKCKGAPAPKKGAISGSDAELKTLCAEKIRGGFCGAGKCATGKCGDAFKERCAKIIEGKKDGAM